MLLKKKITEKDHLDTFKGLVNLNQTVAKMEEFRKLEINEDHRCCCNNDKNINTLYHKM